jgi:hypothetical protein
MSAMKARKTATLTIALATISAASFVPAFFLPIGGSCAGPGMLFIFLGMLGLSVTTLSGIIWGIQVLFERNRSIQE